MGELSGSRSGQHAVLPSQMGALTAAASEKDVIGAVREYLASWSPSMLARLPEPCRPGRMAYAEDINETAFRLSQGCLDFQGDSGDRTLLEGMSAFFAHAVARLSALQRERSALQSDNFPFF